MRKKYVQMSLLDIYHSVEERLENDKPELFRLLEEHLDWDELIPDTFHRAFYLQTGRKRKYELESFLRALFLQRIFHYVEDIQLLNTLRFSYEMRDYCGFERVPDAAKLTRFKQQFCGHIRQVFERLVELTEPICREMDKALSDMLLFDTTGIESYVAENNPKRLSRFVPDAAASNPQVKLQYINGHMCFAQKAAVITNGLGIVRRLELIDEDFRAKHPELLREKRIRDPEIDKEIGDSTALKPVLLDFKKEHPAFAYGTFVGDSAFDGYDNYTFLLGEYGFSKAIIPINPRGGSPAAPVGFNENGTPLCPKDATPFAFHGLCGGSHRSERLKFVCPGSHRIGTTMVNRCETPCTASAFARCVYVYPHKNYRLYPGISRDDPLFETVYKNRAAVERSIYSLKDTLGLANRKTSNVLTTKADLFLAGIVQLLCVLLAHKLHDTKLARRPRMLVA